MSNHRVEAYEPAWVRTVYWPDSEGGMTPVSDSEVMDFIDDVEVLDDPRYECSCGGVFQSRRRLEEHFEEVVADAEL